jgi:hypothetical protein
VRTIHDNESLVRLAVAIRDELNVRSHQRRLVELPVSAWEACLRITRQIRRAELRGWHLAAGELTTDLRYSLAAFESQVADILRELPSSTLTEKSLTTREIYEDLVALSEEFEEIHYDQNGRWLSVTTEPLELESIFLGPFEIRLNWRRGELTYRVIATDPHPPESRENVTHPHVMDDLLCEGEGRHAIRQALAQGRLLDFFTLVAGVLRNYNPESPFVELALWSGQSCSDCGAVVREDDYYTCQKCDSAVCSGCEVSCCGCNDSYCSECVASYSVCHDSYCAGCLGRCQQCRIGVCSGCLDEQERCSTCHEERQYEEGDDCPLDISHAAIQSDRVGQAAISA